MPVGMPYTCKEQASNTLHSYPSDETAGFAVNLTAQLKRMLTRQIVDLKLLYKGIQEVVNGFIGSFPVV